MESVLITADMDDVESGNGERAVEKKDKRQPRYWISFLHYVLSLFLLHGSSSSTWIFLIDGLDMMSHRVTKAKNVKTKGRGFGKLQNRDNDLQDTGGLFESLEDDENSVKSGAARSVEGWIIFITNIHEEAQEDDVYDLFADYGTIKQLHLNLDRRSGYVKGYALIEYEKFSEAQKAISSLDGTELLEQKIDVNWAFQRNSSDKK